MKVCVVGLGAVGGFMAHRLVEGGQAVSALARGATLEAVRRHGLRLSEAPHEAGTQTPQARRASQKAAARPSPRAVPVNVQEDPRALGPQDYVILAVKTTALAEAAKGLAPLLHEDTVIVSAMNGVPWWFFSGLDPQWQSVRLVSTDPEGRLATLLPAKRVIGCVLHMAASLIEPGWVQHGFGQRFILGEPGGVHTARLQWLADTFRHADLDVEVTPQIEEEVWLKLWGNMTMNPISAFTGATMDQVLAEPGVLRFMSAAMLEATAIGARFGLPIRMSPEERHEVTRKLGALRTSMLQDVQAGRPLEIDALVGAVAEMAEVAQVDAPNIQALLGFVRLFAHSR